MARAPLRVSPDRLASLSGVAPREAEPVKISRSPDASRKMANADVGPRSGLVSGVSERGSCRGAGITPHRHRPSPNPQWSPDSPASQQGPSPIKHSSPQHSVAPHETTTESGGSSPIPTPGIPARASIRMTRVRIMIGVYRTAWSSVQQGTMPEYS